MSVDASQVAATFQSTRRALAGYLTQLVVREDIAEELVQQTAVRALEQDKLPETAAEMRAWFFRVGTNLALDYLRKHSTWREGVLGETRGRAEEDSGFVASSRLLVGSPEMKTIAKDHLAVCFSCTLRNLRHEESAALLLKEVYDFTNEEVARIMDASFGQVKAWIQSARALLKAKYDDSCALVAQEGVCFQCVELDRFFEAGQGDPLAGSRRDVTARLTVLRERREAPLGPWHRQMMRLVEDVLDEGPSTTRRRGH